MKDDGAEKLENELSYLYDVELSDRELFFIGKIVALWGSLEYEIFCQTVTSFGDLSDRQLPKGNERFSELLRLWESRVVNKSEGRRKEILQEQCRHIRHHEDFRNALVHGMWDWSVDAPHEITATRVRKKEVKCTTFTADDLQSFALALAKVTNHRLKATALVTGWKPCSGRRPARWSPHQAGFKK